VPERDPDGELQVVRAKDHGPLPPGVHGDHRAERLGEEQHCGRHLVRPRTEEFEGDSRRQAHGPHLERRERQERGRLVPGQPALRQLGSADPGGGGRGQAHPVRRPEPVRRRRLQLVLLHQRPEVLPLGVRLPPGPRADLRGRLQPGPAGGRPADRLDVLDRTPADPRQYRGDHEIRWRHRPSGREAEGDRGEPRTDPHHPRRDRQTDQTARGGPRRRPEVQGPERAPVDGQGPARVQEPRTDRASDRRHERTDRETRSRQRETGGPEGGTPEAARRRRRAPERTRTADGGAGRRRGEAAQGEAGWPAHRTRARDGRNRDVEGIVLEGDRTKESMSRLESEIAQLEESRKAYQVEHDDADWQLKELRNSTKESGKSLQKLQEEFHEKRAEEAKLAREQADLQTAILSLTRQYAQLKAEADVAENMKRGYT